VALVGPLGVGIIDEIIRRRGGVVGTHICAHAWVWSLGVSVQGLGDAREREIVRRVKSSASDSIRGALVSWCWSRQANTLAQTLPLSALFRTCAFMLARLTSTLPTRARASTPAHCSICSTGTRTSGARSNLQPLPFRVASLRV
jgi:hypothetical protein